MIKVGSIITLNSGGPCMTVEMIQDDLICAMWFVDDIIHRDGFIKEQLILIRE
jgi:uncharacterized protein YodC (DUF2158 family)